MDDITELRDLQRVLTSVFTALYPPDLDGPGQTVEVADLPRHVADLRAERDRLQAALDKHGVDVERSERINQLIADSSLGTPGARSLAERTSHDAGYAIRRTSEEMARADAAEAERDRLRTELSALHDVAAVLRDGTEEYAGVVARVVAERDRLRAVVDAAVAFAEVAERPGPHNDPATQAMDYVASRRALIQAVAGLDQGPEATDG
jgi:hypothetical protein